MKKLESSLLNMLLVLTSVTVVAVGLLAYVNELTKEPIAQANLNTLNNALKEVVPAFTNNPVEEAQTITLNVDGKEAEFIVYPAKDGDKVVGTAVEASSNGFSGAIKILIGFDENGKIHDYSLLAHSETPGLGSKANTWFKKDGKGSIIGMNPGEGALIVSKDGGQIDAITASTITSRAFLNAVNNAYAAYKGENDGLTSATPQADANTAATAKADSTKIN
ncbi:RnfABCDGE type electron transport complex subunit G [Bacteroides sp. 214]|uniref:RnfABCDGE type electron transport complex subunit G n=1 Tax=Bacteroides sp. 214 TaxID=2302935 RepID=UPI0013D70E89|nr:RnfABCDGE type electron transport complex subunit G [Bacteroides sp. 214]NDW12789.1 RnfABCDGE type electron transport complex subunit G [Bacteroides sp. 214]